MVKIYCDVTQVSPVPRKFKNLKNQIKPAKLNKWPSRDRHRNGKNPRKPLRCVFYTKWWTCRVEKLRNKNT
jgi:hypothetical protein